VSRTHDVAENNSTADSISATTFDRRGKRRGSSVAKASCTIALAALARAYLADLRVRNFKPKTIQGYANKLARFTRWAESVGAFSVQDFDSNLVKRYIAYLQTQQRWESHPRPKRTPQPPLADSAIRNYVRDLKPFATWLQEEQYTAENVLADVRKPKADETPIEPFTEDEIRCIFSSLDPTDPFGLRDYVVLHTLWDTGLRVGELVALTLDDVDLQRCEIRVTHAKFGKWRDVGFGKQTHKYLTRYLNMARPQAAIDRDRHFFLSPDGYPLQEGTVQRLCTRLSGRIGVHIHCHRFRHTFAVNMLRNGTDIRTLQKLMGHASIQVLTRYLNLATADAIQAHQSNSPADHFYAAQLSGARRLPIKRSASVI
jgi:integrase/recombinase XerD